MLGMDFFTFVSCEPLNLSHLLVVAVCTNGIEDVVEEVLKCHNTSFDI